MEIPVQDSSFSAKPMHVIKSEEFYSSHLVGRVVYVISVFRLFSPVDWNEVAGPGFAASRLDILILK